MLWNFKDLPIAPGWDRLVESLVVGCPDTGGLLFTLVVGPVVVDRAAGTIVNFLADGIKLSRIAPPPTGLLSLSSLFGILLLMHLTLHLNIYTNMTSICKK